MEEKEQPATDNVVIIHQTQLRVRSVIEGATYCPFARRELERER